MSDQTVTESDRRELERRFPWERLVIALIIIFAVAALLPILLVVLPGNTSYVEIKP
ncbi:MAG TPA: hypothetical protein VNG70_11325 [Candidatus Limnocylindria bacterium]|jgi:hypothetical protein|nr:hypothetical protein [Candidatus Limnocylindria bacterium]